MPRTGVHTATMPDIEVERRKRMLALQEKMATVLSASTELQQVVAQPSRQAPRPRKTPALRVLSAEDSRRSGRIAGKGAVNYDENHLSGVDPTEKVKHVRARKALFSGKFNEACREESYGEEHVLALGVANQEWILFKDGFCSQTGKRIYDKVDGVTCHQCRQKTLGKRTSCSRCNTLFGQLCGDCLFMRYGENVDEANAAAEWVCPCCRDLCNCSAHRSRRGWAPTGTMYRAALAEGYLSVAHCLVLNRLQPDALAAVRAGTLAVPGGYPEKWAQDNGVPFPPGSAAVAPDLAAGPSAAAVGSPDSAEGTVEARVLSDGAAPGAPEAPAAGVCSQPSGDSERTIADGDGDVGADSCAGGAGDVPNGPPHAKPPLAPTSGVKKRGARGSASKAVAAPPVRRGKVTRSMAKGLSGIVVEQPLGDATNTLGGPLAGTIPGALKRARRRSVL